MTLNFNRQLRHFARKLKVDYDTHGDSDYFARLYFERLKPFVD